jgi:hypothetical protein
VAGYRTKEKDANREIGVPGGGQIGRCSNQGLRVRGGRMEEKPPTRMLALPAVTGLESVAIRVSGLVGVRRWTGRIWEREARKA